MIPSQQTTREFDVCGLARQSPMRACADVGNPLDSPLDFGAGMQGRITGWAFAAHYVADVHRSQLLHKALPENGASTISEVAVV